MKPSIREITDAARFPPLTPLHFVVVVVVFVVLDVPESFPTFSENSFLILCRS